MNPSHPSNDRRTRIWAEESGGELRVASALSAAVTSAVGGPPSGLSIVCIGSDRSTGDCLGPLVGSLLTDRGFRSRMDPAQAVRVVGTLEEPVHAGNLAAYLMALDGTSRSGTAVIAVDACLGRSEHVGSVVVGSGPLRPGAGVNKDLPPAGDVHIAGIVNVGGFMEYVVLQNTRLRTVIRLAHVIAAGVAIALSQLGFAQCDRSGRTCSPAVSGSGGLEAGSGPVQGLPAPSVLERRSLLPLSEFG